MGPHGPAHIARLAALLVIFGLTAGLAILIWMPAQVGFLLVAAAAARWCIWLEQHQIS